MINYNISNTNFNMSSQNNDHYQNNDLSNNSIVNSEQQHILQLAQIEKLVQEKENQIPVLRDKIKALKYEEKSIAENIKAPLYLRLQELHYEIHVLDNQIQALERDKALYQENEKIM